MPWLLINSRKPLPSVGVRADKLMQLLVVLWLVLLLAGCSTGRGPSVDGPPDDGSAVASAQDVVPRHEPKSRYGNPASYVVFGKRYFVRDSAQGYVERGIASWYGTKFHGRRTSSGETYDMHAMTAAHKSLPLPAYVRVTNLKNNRQLILRVNDRGPFHGNRIIDLSFAAATKLDIVGNGTGLVEVRALTGPGVAQSTPAANVAARPQTQSARIESSRNSSANGEPQLYLQAGAFSSVDNAHQLRARLQSMRLAAVSVQAANVNGKILHRVRVGPLADVPNADRISQDIVNAGMALPRIVIEMPLSAGSAH
ncbi:MAG: rare lipoprotein A [Gammaproteobacteria bacterium]|jgi:rare lipoprotein A